MSKKTYTQKPKFNWYYNLLESFALKKAKREELRGYPIDSYVLFRYIWSIYWTIFVTGFIVYSVPGSLVPVIGVWYGNALGLAGMEDNVTIAALYFVPYLFAIGLLFIGCVAVIRFVAKWFKRRNDFLIKIHFELKNKDSGQNRD